MQMDFPFFCVLLCVGKEVDKHLLQALFICGDLEIVCHFGGIIKLHSFRFSIHYGREYEPAHFVAMAGSQVHGVFAAFQCGKVKNIVDKRGEQFGVVLDERAEF